MGDIHRRLAAVSDTRGRIVAIFVGAVLLPSIALSVLSFNAVPKHAENLKISLLKQSEQLLSFVEQDLETATRRKALEAARAVGPELMLEGRPAQVEAALARAGLADLQFDSLRLEAWSKTRVARGPAEPGSAEMRALSEALSGVAPRAAREEEDSVPLTTVSGEELGVVRFRFTCDYAHRRLVREFFERDFVNPEGAWVDPGDGARRRAAVRERAQPQRRALRGGAGDDARPPTRACGSSCATATARSSRRCGGWPSPRPPSSASST